MISSEMPEILGMSDRVMVMRQGRVAGILDRPRRQSGRPHEAGRPLTNAETVKRRRDSPGARRHRAALRGVGWSVRGASFLFNGQRLLVMVLQVSIIGLLAIGVTQVILTGGIDLVVRLGRRAVGDDCRQPRADTERARGVPVADRSAGRRPGRRRSGDRCAGRPRERQPHRLHRHSAVHRHARHDGERARPRALLHQRPAGEHADGELHAHRRRRGARRHFPGRRPSSFTCCCVTRDTENTPTPSAPTRRRRACPASGSSSHLLLVYTVAGLLSGLGGVVTSARAASGQAGMGMSYELDAIAAAVIGGTSLSGGIGRITGTVDRHGHPGHHDERVHVHRPGCLHSGHRQRRSHRLGGRRRSLSPSDGA